MMHVKFYVHENLTAAGNFNKIFPCNIQNLNAADIFQLLQQFSKQHLIYSMQISKNYLQSKFSHGDNLFISLIFYCVP